MSKQTVIKLTTTTASFLTIPAGVFWIDIYGCGGGGAGAAGTSSSVVASQQCFGGSGGGGALLNFQRVPVTPGTVLDGYVGAGGTGGTNGASPGAGSDGYASSVAIHGGATLATLPGGGGGLAIGLKATTANAAVAGGSPIQGTTLAMPQTTAAAIITPLTMLPSQGGFAGACTAAGGVTSVSTAGAPSLQGFTGGTAGAQGSDSSSTRGGGGGGGGGAGPFGNGGNGGHGGNAGTTDGTTNLSGGKNPAGSVSNAASTNNTGAGGGGGAGAGCLTSSGSSVGSNGGGGDSGLLYIFFTAP